jgi:hypothetical protein
VGLHLGIGEAQHVQASRFDLHAADEIILRLVRPPVYSALKFNHQALLRAEEIGDVPAQRMLAPELQAAQLPIAQTCPQDFLSGRLLLTQLTG